MVKNVDVTKDYSWGVDNVLLFVLTKHVKEKGRRVNRETIKIPNIFIYYL